MRLGEGFIEFCDADELRITYTCFKKWKRRLYTWTSPDGKYKNQIDYVLVKRSRWKSRLLQTNSFIPRNKQLVKADRMACNVFCRWILVFIFTIGVDSGGRPVHAPPIIKMGGKTSFCPPNNQTRIFYVLLFKKRK